MSDNPTFDRIKQNVSNDDVVLFMKGTPVFPQCGFSSVACQALGALDVPFETFDVLQDPEIREGIKVYSSWPTIPQLYIRGEFIGGADIIRELYESGELAKTISKE